MIVRGQPQSFYALRAFGVGVVVTAASHPECPAVGGIGCTPFTLPDRAEEVSGPLQHHRWSDAFAPADEIPAWDLPAVRFEKSASGIPRTGEKRQDSFTRH
jgi:hypothetical protein